MPHLGAMAALSLIAVPVLLDSAQSAPQLFHSWTRMYHYGHQAYPATAIGTLGLWSYAAAQRWSAKKQWLPFALAGIVTVIMIPFTLIVIVPTNDKLFQLEAAGSVLGDVTFNDGKDLIISWAWLHLARSVFPLAGSIIGAVSIFGDRA
jgi:hypothetical protein